MASGDPRGLGPRSRRPGMRRAGRRSGRVARLQAQWTFRALGDGQERFPRGAGTGCAPPGCLAPRGEAQPPPRPTLARGPAPPLCSRLPAGPAVQMQGFGGAWADLRAFGGTPAPGPGAPTGVWPGARLLAATSGRPGPSGCPRSPAAVCLGQWDSRRLLFCSLQAPLPPAAERLLRSSGPKCHQLAGVGVGESSAGQAGRSTCPPPHSPS